MDKETSNRMSEKATRRESNWTTSEVVVFWAVVVLIAAHYAFSFVPGIMTWGLSYWSAIDIIPRTSIMVFALLFCIPPFSKFVDGLSAKLPWRGVTILVTSIIGVSLLVLLRVNNYFFGDGHYILSDFGGTHFPIQVGHRLAMFGDLFVHWATARLLSLVSPVPLNLSYLVWGIAAGPLSVWAMIRFARHLFPSRTMRLFVICAGLTAAPVYFWFGHIECYTLATVVGLWVCVLSLETLQNRKRLLLTWSVLVLAAGFHALSLSLLPMVVWVSLSEKVRSRIIDSRFSYLWFVVSFVLAGIGAQFLRAFGSQSFVPLFSNDVTSYTALSVEHLTDTANVLLRASPLIVVSLLLIAFIHRHVKGNANPRVVSTLAIGALGSWLLSFWTDPAFGAPRDWDLLSMYGFPMTLLSVALIAQRVSDLTVARTIWVPMAVLAFVHTVGLVIANRDVVTSAIELDRILRRDVHHSMNYFGGQSRITWSMALGKWLGNDKLVIENLEELARDAPENPVAWTNLGLVYMRNEEMPKATRSYKKAVLLAPQDSRAIRQLGRCYIQQQDWMKASTTYDQLLQIDPESLPGNYFGGIAAAQTGQDSLALGRFSCAIHADSSLTDAYFNRARLYWKAGDLKSAISDLESLIARDSTDFEARELLKRLEASRDELKE